MKYEKYKKGQNDLFSGIVLGGFAIAYLIGAAMIKIPKMLSASLLNASSVPKLWGVLLLILGIVLIVRGLRTMKAEKAAGNAPEKKSVSEAAKGFWADNRAVVEMFVVLLVYIALIQPVGFLISTFLFLFAEFNILTYKEDRKLGFSIIFALVCGRHLRHVQVRLQDAASAGHPEGNLLKEEGTDYVDGRFLHGPERPAERRSGGRGHSDRYHLRCHSRSDGDHGRYDLPAHDLCNE